MREISAGKGSMSLSLVASVIAHGALLLAVAVPSVRDRLMSPLGSDEPKPPQAETWAGTTAELPSGETLYDVQLTGAPPAQPGSLSPPATPAEPPATPPAPPAPPEPTPPPPAETSPKAPPPPPRSEEPERPKPKPASPQKSAPTGEEEPSKAPAKPPKEEDDPYADLSAEPKPAPKPPKEPVAAKPKPDNEEPDQPSPKPSANPKTPKPPAVAGTPKPASPGGADTAEPSTENPAKTPGMGGTGSPGGSFGAVGRAGVRDLGSAFTKAIPAAGNGDPTWSSLPLGDGGSIRVVLDIDENGRIAGWTPVEKSPPKHLKSLAANTVFMLKSGVFALRSGGVTAGRQTVEVSATVGMSDKPVTSGGLIELSHAFENGVGKASFVQATGREVTFRVRVIRIEVTAAPTGG